MRLEVIPDERSGAGKLTGMVRAKAYLKPGYPLDAYTPIPDVASRVLGCTWTQANEVALVDCGGCNMDCVGCYQAGRSQEFGEAHPSEVAKMFSDGAANSPVWRISGGEPTLQDDFPEVLREVLYEAGDRHIVWVNTNGLLGFEPLTHAAWSERVFVEVSLKGFTNAMAAANARLVASDVLDRQLNTVRELVHEGANVLLNVYASAPEPFEVAHFATDCGIPGATELLGALEDIDPTLPFRVTPVHVKRYDWWPEDAVQWVSLVGKWNDAKHARYSATKFVDLNAAAGSFLGLGSANRPGIW